MCEVISTARDVALLAWQTRQFSQATCIVLNLSEIGSGHLSGSAPSDIRFELTTLNCILSLGFDYGYASTPAHA